VRQLTFEFVPPVRYLIRFPAKVRKELVSLMARAITQAAEKGGKDEKLRGERQDHGEPPQP
jgi:hypothetical protein